MAYVIGDACISCGACAGQCPVGAIAEGDGKFEISADKKIHNVKFIGGCSGNTQGVAKLVEGMDADEVIKRLEGIRCGNRPTSCPDQLSKAIKKALA